MAKLESLIVDLQLNSAELKKGLDAANKKLEGFDKKVGELAGLVKFDMIGKAALQAGQSLATLVMHGVEAADKMGKMAQSAGVSVESFSRLNHAAGLADVSTEQLGTAMLKLNKNLAAAGTGGQEQVALFNQLGVAVKDSSGKMRAADAVMGDLAEVFSQMEGGAAKASLATEVFGKSGAELLPLLNGGRDGLAAAAAEADRFGLTVSASAAKSAEGFNDNLTKMRTVLDAVGQRIAAQVAPAFEALTTELLGTKDGASLLSGVVDTLSVAIKGLISAGVIVGAILEGVGKAIGASVSMLVNQISGDFDAAREDALAIFSSVGDAASKASERLKKVWADTAEATGESDEKRGKSGEKTAEEILAAIAAEKKAAEEYKASFAGLTKVAEDLESKVATYGFGELGLIEASLNSGELAKQLEKVGDQADELRQRILDAAQALSDLKVDAKMGEIKVTVDRANADVDRDVAARRNGFGAATRAPATASYAASLDGARVGTKGFADFDAALKRLAEQSKLNAKLLGQAELLKYQNDLEGAKAATLAAENAKRAADEAGKAADAFTQLGQDLVGAREKSIKEAAGAGSWADAMKVLQANFQAALGGMPDLGAELTVWFDRMSGQLAAAGTQMLGAVGELVNSVVQGAQAGGVWGAIIAAFMEVAKKTESALKFLDTAMQFIEKIAVMVEPLVAPIFEALQGVLEIVVDIVAPVFRALQPLFTAIGQLVEDLSPILWALGDLFESLSPIIQFVGEVIGKVFKALKPIFDLIGGVIKVIATVILGVLIGLNELAAAFGDEKAKAEADRLKQIVSTMWDGKERSASQDLSARSGSSDISTTGNVAASGDVIATGPVEMKAFDISNYGLSAGGQMDVIDIGGWGYAAGSQAGAEAALMFVEAAALMNGATAEAAAALGDAAYTDFLALGEAAGEAAKNLAEFSSSLTNVPEGFRYAAAAYNATGETPDATPFGGAGGTVVHVHGSIFTDEDVAAVLERVSRRDQFRRTGFGSLPSDQP